MFIQLERVGVCDAHRVAVVGLYLDVTARARYRLLKLYHVTHLLRYIRLVQRILSLDNQIPLVGNRTGIAVKAPVCVPLLALAPSKSRSG